ncbi:SDR family oxidoreductase [Phenylobacterium sp. LjRoot225]|uniref:SDR family NAD(P)-dependent oxidoreductase n=1 Tax=Phenylobacterium sp. LjRoot225 TaxID=3342285 RepID=UPI003ECE3A8C
MDLQLAGKRAVITGASRGIGKAIARQLSREGVDLVLAARHGDALLAAAEEIACETGRRVRPIIADTGLDASVDALIEAAVSELGGLDILINNAATPGGAAPAGRLAEVSGQALLDDVNVKVGGYLRTARAAAPHLTAAGWGRIVNIGGLAARKTGHYVASIRNVGVSALTKNLADELGPLGVTVNAIHPGATRTEKTTPEAAEKAGRGVTIGRIVEAQEIALLTAFLASPLSAALNGETLQAGGGAPGVIDY